MFVGVGLTLLLETLFGGPDIFYPLVPVAFVGGLVLAFVVLVRLYRAMPGPLRRAIEIVDDADPGPRAPPVVQPSVALTGAELAALDAKLATPRGRTDQDR